MISGLMFLDPWQILTSAFSIIFIICILGIVNHFIFLTSDYFAELLENAQNIRVYS
jgi:flagellar biosynthesis protein FlhB